MIQITREHIAKIHGLLDKGLSVVGILIKMDAPGCQWLEVAA